jgi:N-sulfoglucosamine sulfohydrolase
MLSPLRAITRAVLCAMLAAALAAQADERLNVLWITVDDMSCDSVGAFGCELAGITPNIDRLAAEGLRFEHAHVTVAICQPTRAVWMTGRYPHRSGALGFDRIRSGVPTLVEAVHDAGWFTGLLGKTPHVVPSRHDAFDVIVKALALGQGRSPERYREAAKAFFAKSVEAGKPFFLMANAHDPHRPFAGSQQEANRKKRDRNKKGRTDFPEAKVEYDPREVPLPGFLPDLDPVRLELAEYFTSVHRADATVGALLRALDESGLAARTLVMFLSDHGMPLPFAKTNCWRHSTRTPWIVRWPETTEPGAVDEKHMIAGIDLAPTILDALELDPLDGADGRSFAPLLRGETQDGRERVFTHINTIASKRSYAMRAVDDRRFGYIYNAWSDGETVFRNESQSGRTFRAMRQAAERDPAVRARVELFVHRVPEELYDYANDPDALENLIDDPAQAKRVAEFRRLLRDEMRKTGDPELGAYETFLAGR